MAYLVDAYTIAAGLRKFGLKAEADTLHRALEGALNTAAAQLGAVAGFSAETARLEEAEFGGLLVKTLPLKPGDPLPEVLKGADAEEEWGQ